MAIKSKEDTYPFEGIVEFDFTIEVAGRKATQKARISYKHEPDGLYFHPKKKVEAEGTSKTTWSTEFFDTDENVWDELNYGIFINTRLGKDEEDGPYIGDLDEHLVELIEEDAMRQSNEARLAHEQAQASASPKH